METSNLANIKVRDMRKMLNIQRLAGTFKLRSYNLAEHSYFTGMLVLKFCAEEGIQLTALEIEKIFSHDLLEVLTSDLLHHVKNLNEKTKQAWELIEQEVALSRTEFAPFLDSAMKDSLRPEVHDILKASDTLELWLFCEEEKTRGNKTIEIDIVAAKCLRTLEKYAQYRSIQRFIYEMKTKGENYL